MNIKTYYDDLIHLYVAYDEDSLTIYHPSEPTGLGTSKEDAINDLKRRIEGSSENGRSYNHKS